MSLTQTAFDYAALEAESRIVVQQKTSEIRERVRRAAEDVVAIGQRLLIVKGHLEHGRFGEWLAAEFQWSESSARKMMAVADRFKTVNFTDLTIGPSALYLLASDSVPDEVRAEIVEKAKSGEPVTHADVKARVEAARPARTAPLRHTTSDAQVAADEAGQDGYDDTAHDVPPDDGPVVQVKREADPEPAEVDPPTRRDVAKGLQAGGPLPLVPVERAALAPTTEQPLAYDAPEPAPATAPFQLNGHAPTKHKPSGGELWAKAVAETCRIFNDTRDAGNIAGLVRSWAPGETNEYLSMLREFRDVLGGWITDLEKQCKTPRKAG